jgi:hypothetical protein
MTKNTQKNNVLNTFQEGSDRVAEAFKTIGNMEIPEVARDFIKRAAAVAKERVDSAHGEAEKATAAAEGALTRSVRAVASIVRSAENALYQDVEAFVTSVTQLASAGSLGEAFKIQSNYMLACSEVAVARAKSVADYLGRPFSEGANSVQESFAKAG